MSDRQNNLDIDLSNAHSALGGKLCIDLGNPATLKDLLEWQE